MSELWRSYALLGRVKFMSTSKNPPAFPSPPGSLDSVGIDFDHGMSLRDYFAAAAMNGLLSSGTVLTVDGKNLEYSAGAYFIADSMLAEREKKT